MAARYLHQDINKCETFIRAFNKPNNRMQIQHLIIKAVEAVSHLF